MNVMGTLFLPERVAFFSQKMPVISIGPCSSHHGSSLCVAFGDSALFRLQPRACGNEGMKALSCTGF